MWIRIFVLIIFTAKLATSEHQTISQFDKVYLDQSMNFLETEKNGHTGNCRLCSKSTPFKIDLSKISQLTIDPFKVDHNHKSIML